MSLVHHHQQLVIWIEKNSNQPIGIVLPQGKLLKATVPAVDDWTILRIIVLPGIIACHEIKKALVKVQFHSKVNFARP
jgi:hypothetical protein